jgi:RNA polymerase sigma-B factor
MLIEWSAHDRWLLDRARQGDDPRALDEFVRRMLPLVQLLARKYKRGREPLEDLVQVASLGLLKAIAGFDPARGHFVAYAIPTITGTIRRHYRDNGWTVHVERGLQERALKVKRLRERAALELGRFPTSSELAARAELSVEQVLEAQGADSAYTPMSLDAPTGDDQSRLALLGVAEDPRYLLIEEVAVLGSVLRVLPERERQILVLRFGAGLSQTEIGERLGISQMHVSRLLRRALERATRIAAHRGESESTRPERRAA